MIRKPVVAGQFYPQTAVALRKMLNNFISESQEKREATGLVMPHAGYIYSGRVAGAVVSSVILKETAVILGTNHTGGGAPFSIMTEGAWSTPFGEVEIDSDLAKEFLSGSTMLEEDIMAHLYEHSIEVELPFLQFINEDIKIVPIVVSQAALSDYQKLGDELSAIFKKTKKYEALFISSTDMTHYESQRSAETKDRSAIEAILKLDEMLLEKTVEAQNISMCGNAPTSVLIRICKNLGAKKAELIKYETSGTTTGDYSSVVGYAGLIIC